MPAPPLVSLQNLTKHFPAQQGLWSRAGTVHALDGVTLEVRQGETLGLVGESGSGKSTLGLCALRLLEPTSGAVLFDGRDLSKLPGAALRRLRRHMQIIFQDPTGSLNPHLRVQTILAEPFQIHEPLSRTALAERLRDLLRSVGLGDDARARYPREFSAGQRQRIAIARALALQPKFIVADEPVSSLDVSVGAQIVNLLQDLQKQHQLTYLFISHNLAVVRHISNRTAVMYLGVMVELGNTEDVLRKPLHPYTALLLSSTPDVSHAGRQELALVPGELPSAVAPPSGCRFRTRCPMAQERCAEETPPLRELAAGHWSACHFAEEVPARLPAAKP